MIYKCHYKVDKVATIKGIYEQAEHPLIVSMLLMSKILNPPQTTEALLCFVEDELKDYILDKL